MDEKISKDDQIITMNKIDSNNNIEKTIPSSNSFEAVYLNNLRISFDGKMPPSDSINSIFDYNFKIANQLNSLDTILQSEEETLENKVIKNNVAIKIKSFQEQENLKNEASIIKEKNSLKIILQKNQDEKIASNEENILDENRHLENNVTKKIHSFQGQSLLKRAGSLDDRKNSTNSFTKMDANFSHIENLKKDSKISFTGSCHSVKDLRGKFENFTSTGSSLKKFPIKNTSVTRKGFQEAFQPVSVQTSTDIDRTNMKVKDRVYDLNKVSELVHLNEKKIKESKTTLKIEPSLTKYQNSLIDDDPCKLRERAKDSTHADDFIHEKNDFIKLKSRFFKNDQELYNKQKQTDNDQYSGNISSKILSNENSEKESKSIFLETNDETSECKSKIFDSFKTKSVALRQSKNCTKILNISKQPLNRDESFKDLNINNKSVIGQENRTEKRLTPDEIIDVLKKEIDLKFTENFGNTTLKEKKVDETLMEVVINKLCESIKKTLSEKFEKHKFVVKSVIGHSLFEMPVVSHICYWDEHSDTCATYSFSKENHFVMVTAFAIFTP